MKGQAGLPRLIEALLSRSDDMDPALDPLWEEAIRDTIDAGNILKHFRV